MTHLRTLLTLTLGRPCGRSTSVAMMKMRLLMWLMLLLTVSVSGCGVLLGPKADPKLAAALSPLPYPKDAPLGDDLDIIAVRQGTTLTLVNRTPRTFTNVQLWLNQQYVSVIEQIAIGNPTAGNTNTHHLVGFINRHGEPYPTGGLLRPETSYPLVHAEIFDPASGQRHRLTVRLNKDFRESM